MVEKLHFFQTLMKMKDKKKSLKTARLTDMEKKEKFSAKYPTFFF